MVRKTHNQPPEEIEPEGYLVGYARVSTADQNLDMQIEALKRYGVQEKWIFTEKASATLSKRPELARLWRELRPGDTLVVWRLDRLGRSVLDLLTRMQELEKRGVRFVSLQDFIDTKTAVGRLMLNVLAAMAQFERDLTSERTKAAIAAKKRAGLPHGMAPKFDRRDMEKRLLAGEKVGQLSKAYGVTRSAIYQAMTPALRRQLAKMEKAKPRGRGRIFE